MLAHMRWGVVVFVLGAAGCLEEQTVTCPSNWVCPANTVCSAHGCVQPDQLVVCEGLDEGTACTAAGITGTCQEGACLPEPMP
jgi:hypothetical protein